MKFKRNLKLEYGLRPIEIVPFINILFLLLIFFMLSTSFTFQQRINVRLPKAVTSDIVKAENLVITITSEDVLYMNGKIITPKELQAQFTDTRVRNRPVLIKADRRASVGRIVDIWDLCRNFGIEKINIATTQGQ